MTQRTVLLLDLKSYYPSPPYQLGLLVAHAQLDESVKSGIEFKFSEHQRNATAESIVAAIEETNPSLVAASDYSWNHPLLARVLTRLESSQAKPWVLLGGPNCAGKFGRDLFSKFPTLSAIVEGEGELAFLDICRQLVNAPQSNPFASARNCISRATDGSLAEGSMKQRITHLDDTPSPYLSGVIAPGPAPLFYETNRGCPYRCSFCYWGSGHSRVYRMSFERIREEMTFFAESGVEYFWLADANFGLFKEDLDLAKMIGEVSATHGYPFKKVGVNWAKNSSDRILDIAASFRAQRIQSTTTLALQTVTPQAERDSRRFSMPSSQLRGLVVSADRRDIDTYTDLIWGLPGEGIEDFLAGLEAVASTGIPAIAIHQLALLPGTEFFERRDEFGLEIHEDTSIDESHAEAPFAEYVVARHPKMTDADRITGCRFIGVNHLLHNHNLGRIVGSFLSVHGVALQDIYRKFDEVLSGDLKLNGLSPQAQQLLSDLARRVDEYSTAPGADGVYFHRELSEKVWFTPRESGLGFDSRFAAVEELMIAFFLEVVRPLNLGQRDLDLISDLTRYNVIVSPKPTWQPADVYRFSWDVLAIAKLIEKTTLRSPPAADQLKKRTERSDWSRVAPELRASLGEALTPEFLQAAHGKQELVVKNPWQLTPSRTNLDWLLSSRSKHCTAQRPTDPENQSAQT